MLTQRRLAIGLLLFVPLAICASCATAPAADTSKLIRGLAADHRVDFIRVYYHSEVVGKDQAFALYVPPTYNAEKATPVVVFLHSYWTNYDDKQYYRVTELPGTIQEQCDRRGWIAVEPEGDGNSWYVGKAEEQVLETVQQLKAFLNVDDTRLYLIGRSMGGAGALTIAMHHPDKVAGVVSLAGISDYAALVKSSPYLLNNEPGSVRSEFGGTPEDKPAAYHEMSAVNHVDVLKKMPVYLIHGGADDIVPVTQSQTLAKLLQDGGGQISYKEVPGEKHNMEMIERFAADYFKFLDEHSR